MSLKDLLKVDKKVNNIKIKVLEIEDKNIIVADQTMVAICRADDSNFLVKDNFYMLVKPIKHDDLNFILNEKLKPVKIKEFKLQNKEKEVQRLVNILKKSSKETTNSDAQENLKTFSDIIDLPPGSEIKVVTVKVIAKSKDIAGQYGNYNIGKIKDKIGEKIDINIYNQQVRKNFNSGNIVEIRNLKITAFTRNGETVKRLSTTARSSVNKCSKQIEILFKNVPLGDEIGKGTVLAIHDIFPYLSCSKCWKKTDETDEICQCGNDENIKVIDFHCQFYIQMDKDDEVKVIDTFKRVTSLDPQSKNLEDIQKLLDDTFVDKNFTFEWNINIDEEKLRMVEISNGDKS